MFELLISMLERLGLIVMLAFIATRLRFFRTMMPSQRLSGRQQGLAIIFFGLFAIIGTYSGIIFDASAYSTTVDRPVSLAQEEAIANFRVIGVVLAGLLGGYKVGLGAGIIGGVHRFLLGGYTAFSCGLATIIAGVLAGIFGRKLTYVSLPAALGIGALAEALQMGLILLLSRPFEQVVALVQMIGIPMIVANGLGCALFLLIVKNVANEEEKAGAVQAQKSLQIAGKTLSHLRNGLDETSAKAVCRILDKELDTVAVAITNKKHILAHVGVASDHHQPKMPIRTQVTRDVIYSGKQLVVEDDDIHCDQPACPLRAAIIAPLKQKDEIVGTLKFYFRSKKEVTKVSIELISGLSQLLSNQLEIAKAEQSYQLAKEAEIKALQAQISPHFLFNSLNTVVSLIRTDPIKARKVLISLSHFLRKNVETTTASLTTIEQEIAHVQAYLNIEQTRFEDRLTVNYELDQSLLDFTIPPLTLQPIIENAMKHGINQRKADCRISISVTKDKEHIKVSVSDNGKGISAERKKKLGIERVESETGTGMALYNVNRRLEMVFGEQAMLCIESEENEGTMIHFTLPMEEQIT